MRTNFEEKKKEREEKRGVYFFQTLFFLLTRLSSKRERLFEGNKNAGDWTEVRKRKMVADFAHMDGESKEREKKEKREERERKEREKRGISLE
jgi:hypothetical protein